MLLIPLREQRKKGIVTCMNVKFSLKNASASDIDDIMKIERDAFAPDIQEAESVFQRRIEFFSEGFVLFVDTTSGKTAGYLCSERWKSPELSGNALTVGHDILSAHVPDGNTLYISSFALLKEYRGRGYGRELFSRAVAHIKRRTGILYQVLLVNEEWNSARRIYSSCGFSETGRVPGAFPGSAGVMMRRGR